MNEYWTHVTTVYHIYVFVYFVHYTLWVVTL